jgi:hypothetical protein
MRTSVQAVKRLRMAAYTFVIDLDSTSPAGQETGMSKSMRINLRETAKIANG